MTEREQAPKIIRITKGEYLQRVELVEDSIQDALSENVQDLQQIYRARERLAQAEEDDLIIHFFDRDGGVLFTTAVKQEAGFVKKVEGGET